MQNSLNGDQPLTSKRIALHQVTAIAMTHMHLTTSRAKKDCVCGSAGPWVGTRSKCVFQAMDGSRCSRGSLGRQRVECAYTAYAYKRPCLLAAVRVHLVTAVYAMLAAVGLIEKFIS